jgi:hypothetical protein
LIERHPVYGSEDINKYLYYPKWLMQLVSNTQRYFYGNREKNNSKMTRDSE